MKLYIILILILLFCGSAYGEQSEDFERFLSEKIFLDCKGTNIKVRFDEDFAIRYEDGGTLKHINWPYDEETIYGLTKTLSELEPYNQRSHNNIWSYGRDGQKVIACNEHFLDINYETYFWDGEKIEVPREKILNQYNTGGGDINTAEAIISKPGDQSAINTGDGSITKLAKISFFENPTFTIPITLFGFSISILFIRNLINQGKNNRRNAHDKKISKER